MQKNWTLKREINKQTNELTDKSHFELHIAANYPLSPRNTCQSDSKQVLGCTFNKMMVRMVGQGILKASRGFWIAGNNGFMVV